MRAARRAIAIVSGILMFCACNLVAIRVAKTPLPRNWFAAFGGRSALPVMLAEALLTALALGVIAAVWGYVTLRPTRRRHKPYVAWLLSGIIMAWVGWLIYGAFYFALNPKNYSEPLQSLLLSSAAAPLFGIFNIFAVLAGAIVAGRLAKHHQLQLPARRTRRDGSHASNPPASDSDLDAATSENAPARPR